ncbi:transcriptional regulator GlxA family with amidase domain [Rhizobium pisi]|nr:DJ-1/PfpI family protein [Rhizobium pisi]MBB3139073.1 transcriptional regulator GlxA family with amidase domain [Rhizobium pisi]TCA48867.1 hypothetical protein E0J16_25060 [Rhizobium pisi]
MLGFFFAERDSFYQAGIYYDFGAGGEHKKRMTSKSAKSETTQRARKIVFVIFDQVKLLDIAGPLQVFSDARLADGGSAYDLVVASELGGAVATDSGMVLASQALSDVLDADVDTLLVAGGDPLCS